MRRSIRLHHFSAVLLVLSAATGALGAELDFNTLEVPPETQSSAPAQPQAWTPTHPSTAPPEHESSPAPQQREENAGPGGAVFTPFAETSRTALDHASPNGKPDPAPRGFDVTALVLTLLAVLAGILALAWLVRSA